MNNYFHLMGSTYRALYVCYIPVILSNELYFCELVRRMRQYASRLNPSGWMLIVLKTISAVIAVAKYIRACPIVIAFVGGCVTKDCNLKIGPTCDPRYAYKCACTCCASIPFSISSPSQAAPWCLYRMAT